MRYVLIIIVAGAAWFGWKQYKKDQPAPANEPHKTTGADATNRVDTRSGFVADPP